MTDSLSRREALRSLLLLAAASAGVRSSVAGDGKEARGRVLVLGAGMAGLGAARALVDDGFEVVVLEARERVGGRVWTDRSLGVPVDMGASWIQGSRGNPITELAKKLGVATRATSYDSIYLHDDDGSRVADDDAEALSGEFEGLNKWLLAVAVKQAALGKDISVAEAYRQSLAGDELDAGEERALDWFLSTLELAAAEDLAKLSLFGVDEGDDFGGDDRMFPGGYDAIAKGLAKGLDVRFDRRARLIAAGKDGVRIETEDEIYRGDAAVVTLPLGVLRAGLVRFEPELPKSKLAAVDGLRMGVLDKVALKFPKRFWPADRDFLGYMSKQRGEYPVFLNGYRYCQQPLLIAFTAGSFARAQERRFDEVAAKRVSAALARMFGDDAIAPEALKVARWAVDDYALGSYSYLPVGTDAGVRKQLAAPVGRLFFAGEATSSAYPGTVHGAYLSGLREARRIIES